MKFNRLSKYKIKKIIKCFSEDLTATSTSKLLGINRNTINAYYNLFREKILLHSVKEYSLEKGEFELDESYFGAKRVREKRGRGILHLINKSLKLREYWFNEEVPNYANKKTMGQQDKSENRHGGASRTGKRTFLLGKVLGTCLALNDNGADIC